MNALNFINGVFVDAIDGETLTNLNPATGQTIGTIARSKDSDIEEAVKAAASAQEAWSSLDMLERAMWLDRLAGLRHGKKNSPIVSHEIPVNHSHWLDEWMHNVQSTISDSLLILLEPKNLRCLKCVMQPTLCIETRLERLG